MYLPKNCGVRRVFRNRAPHLNMCSNNLDALMSPRRQETRAMQIDLLLGPDPAQRRLVMQALGGIRSFIGEYCAFLTEGPGGRDDLLTWAKLMQVFTPSPVRRR